MDGITKIIGQNREKTKLKCERGHVWKDIVFTSSALSFSPPMCPKCLSVGIRAVGKPVPIVPLRTKVAKAAKAITITPLKYLVAKPVVFCAKYLVAKPTAFCAKYLVAKPTLLGVGAALFPFRLAGAILHRIINPVPKVLVISDSGRPGFLDGNPNEPQCSGDCERCAAGFAEEEETGFAEEEETGFIEDDEEEGELEECDEAGFIPEPEKTGFAPEPQNCAGFKAEPLRSGFIA